MKKHWLEPNSKIEKTLHLKLQTKNLKIIYFLPAQFRFILPPSYKVHQLQYVWGPEIKRIKNQQMISIQMYYKI